MLDDFGVEPERETTMLLARAGELIGDEHVDRARSGGAR